MKKNIFNDKRVQVSFYCNEKDFKRFNDRFPNCRTLFFTKCLLRAINEDDFLQKVMFEVICFTS